MTSNLSRGHHAHPVRQRLPLPPLQLNPNPTSGQFWQRDEKVVCLRHIALIRFVELHLRSSRSEQYRQCQAHLRLCETSNEDIREQLLACVGINSLHPQAGSRASAKWHPVSLHLQRRILQPSFGKILGRSRKHDGVLVHHVRRHAYWNLMLFSSETKLETRNTHSWRDDPVLVPDWCVWKHAWQAVHDSIAQSEDSLATARGWHA